MNHSGHTANPRYVFVDGLRGLAAMAVVFHHLLECSVLGPVLETILPGPLKFFCSHGSHGVQVFFVISGFVIAHALRNIEPTAGAFGNFVSALAWRGGIPNPIVTGELAFNIADVCAVTGAVALVLGAAVFALRNPALLREPV